jgi:hypothetical protein
VALCLVLVLETIAAERTLVLLFSLVSTSCWLALKYIRRFLSSHAASSEVGLLSVKSDLLEFLNRLEPLGLLGAALAHEEALHFSSARLLHLSDLTCASTRNGPRVN